ncbi:integral membrane protein [Phlyctema vagabunda]|uniref:Integral membrane protein n=1 Tax=Phlyctema vagabunda TaxID=108571 RepID=A0ABR4PIW3_9HELO
MSDSANDAGIGRGAQVIGVAVMSLSLSWISVSLRFYVRLAIQKGFGKEDWLTLVAMILFTALCSLLLETIKFGLGRHMKDIPPHQVPVGAKMIFICELLYVVTTAITKASIGVYFLRLSSRRYQSTIIYSTLVVVTAFSTIYFFFLLFQCHPIAYIWQYYEGGDGYCISHKTLANVTYAHAAMSAATDWSFGLLPVFFVWRMKMNPRTKFSVILILSLGFFASSATLVRIVYIRRLTLTTDHSYEGINIVKWSMVEPAIGITAAAIATLRPLFTQFLGHNKRQSIMRARHHSTSGESQVNMMDSYVGKDSLSSEFREMLGIESVGQVTTTIYAETDKSKDKKSWWKRPQFKTALSQSSTSELYPTGHKGSDAAPFDWNAGIVKSTMVTREE